MPFVAAAGGRPALAAAAGSMTRPPTPSETATASQRLLLGVPATATFPALDRFRARASIAREGCRAPVLPGRTRLHPASPEPPGVRTTRTTRPGTRRAATPPDRRQAAVRAGPLPPVAFRAWLLTFGSRSGRPWPTGPPRRSGQDLGLLPFELLGRDDTTVAQVGELGQLIRRALRSGGLLDVGAELLILALRLLHRVFVHLAAAGDQVDQHAD